MLYESMTGNTKRAAEMLGGAARAAGAEVSVRPVAEPDLHELARADALLIGTWTDGMILFGMRPGGARRLRAMPLIHGKPVGIFCTYAVNPGRTLDKLESIVRGRGGDVVARQALHRGNVEAGIDELVADVVVSVSA